MIYDLCVGAILLYTTFRGAAKGMAWQLAAILALVLCFVFATPASLIVAPLIKVDPPLNRWIAMLAVYLVFSFGCFAAARALRSGLEAAKFEEYDKHLGAVFGLIKGATLCLVATFFVVCISSGTRHYVMKTYSGRAAAIAMQRLTAVMPAEVDKVVEPYLHKLQEQEVLIAREENSAPAGDDSTSPDDERESTNLLEGFRGSSRPDGDRHEADDRDSETPAEDDEAAREGEPAAGAHQEKSLLEKVTDAIEEKFKAGVSKVIHDTFSESEKPTEKPADESAGRPARKHLTKQPRPAPSDHDPLEALVISVSRIFSNSERGREAHRQEIEALLKGIPEPVATAALRDWRADLLGIEPDPDPKTDVASALDFRLVRQLRRAGTDLGDLPRPVAERLREASQE